MVKKSRSNLCLFFYCAIILMGLLIGIRQEIEIHFHLQRFSISYPSPKTYARILARNENFSTREYSCVIKLWTRESNWRLNARNSRSNAYGIPQALPAQKMKVEGSDWLTNPLTQVRWGFRYLKYHWANKPCNALTHQITRGWY